MKYKVFFIVNSIIVIPSIIELIFKYISDLIIKIMHPNGNGVIKDMNPFLYYDLLFTLIYKLIGFITIIYIISALINFIIEKNIKIRALLFIYMSIHLFFFIQWFIYK